MMRRQCSVLCIRHFEYLSLLIFNLSIIICIFHHMGMCRILVCSFFEYHFNLTITCFNFLSYMDWLACNNGYLHTKDWLTGKNGCICVSLAFA
ncbi:hypothetical protein M6B38_149700 [Iris pallida]|uniref:Uncharacterized protein n=1 Tax=Iris pallida TaxID=29817 RepID=A0AAX6F7I4_IRIPA|nr:hypothetical protein M6B38_149700 [Iris pallida]